MKLLFDHDRLELLLERNRDKIGHNSVDGVDTILSGISFFFSTVLANFTDFGPFSPGAIRFICFILSVIFIIWGAYKMIRSLQTKYGHEMLLRDLELLNEISHPFSIIAIRDSFNQYPNRFLLYYDTRWDCKFFIYCPTKDSESDNEDNIRFRLSSELKIDPALISVRYITEQIYQKYSISDRIYKYYDHKLYLADIPFTDAIKKSVFKIDGKSFFWMSIAEMEKDPNIKKKNLDVVYMVRDNIY